MEQLASVLRGVVDRLLNVFQVLDLSFFLPGGVCILALMVLTDVYAPIAPLLTDAGAAVGVLLVLQAYLCGLVCFGAGRSLRRLFVGPWGRGGWKGQLGDEVRGKLEAHGLQEHPSYAPYFPEAGQPADPARFAQLYARMWADIRQDGDLAPSFELVQSYWVRAAVFDGMSVALFAWGLVAFLGERHDVAVEGASVGALLVGVMNGPQAWWGVLVAAALSIAICWWEARRLDRYQVEELVGTFASRAGREAAGRRAQARALVAAVADGDLPAVAAGIAREVAGEGERYPAAFAAALGALAQAEPAPDEAAAARRVEQARAAARAVV